MNEEHPMNEFLDNAEFAIGVVEAVNGNSATCALDGYIINLLRDHEDPSIARCGAPGSILRMNVEDQSLLANLREIELNAHDELLLTASIDFLGAGDTSAEGISHFRRGITQYPRPGDKVYGVRSSLLADVFSTGDRPNIKVGTIYPTADTKASLLIDPMLGMHFAILGSTGTGKSTTAALILHQLIESSPHAHIGHDL